LEWQDARLPIVGRLWATAWLPSILLAGCLVALMYLLQTSSVATTGYDIQHLQAERDAWQLRNEQLQLELDKRQSLTWIEAEATRAGAAGVDLCFVRRLCAGPGVATLCVSGAGHATVPAARAGRTACRDPHHSQSRRAPGHRRQPSSGQRALRQRVRPWHTRR